MIEARTRTVYFSPAANRHFMTLGAAAHKEASKIMEGKYESEKAGPESAGWHWSNDDKLRALHARVKRRLISRFRRAPVDEASGKRGGE
jgi:hypothetical protein